MMAKITPDEEISAQTKIKGTTIAKLCEFDGPGYKRVKEWLEKTLAQTEKPEVKFSGVKNEYVGGATRDNSKGKGRYDLISPLFLKKLAQVLEKGAENHGDNNWKGGIKYSRLIDSTLRHVSQYNEGMRDEEHLTQAVCNLMFLIHFEEEGRTDLNDLSVQQTLL
jgi:hypothetical protein